MRLIEGKGIRGNVIFGVKVVIVSIIMEILLLSLFAGCVYGMFVWWDGMTAPTLYFLGLGIECVIGSVVGWWLLGNKQADFKEVSIGAAIYVACIKTCQWWGILVVSWQSNRYPIGQYTSLASGIMLGEGIFLEILGLIYFYKIFKQRSRWKNKVFIILTGVIVASIFVMDHIKMASI